MNRNERSFPVSIYIIVGIGLFLLFIISRIPGLSLKIGNATPLLLLPALIAAAMFLGDWPGFIMGLLVGTALDSVMVGATYFNAITLMLIGLMAGLLANYILNNNIWSALTLSIVTSVIYFLLKWLFVVVLRGDGSAFDYLLKYTLPSLLYTAFWIVPMYYGMRFIVNKTVEFDDKG